MSNIDTQAGEDFRGETGRASAFIVYALYLLSIPSAAVFALVGVIFAYVARGEATGLARAHLDRQIDIWWTAFWWGVVLALAGIVSAVLTIVLIGFPLLWLVGVAAFVVMVWFTIVSLLGLLRLLDGRGA